MNGAAARPSWNACHRSPLPWRAVSQRQQGNADGQPRHALAAVQRTPIGGIAITARRQAIFHRSARAT
jgi:hypothetical protein